MQRYLLRTVAAFFMTISSGFLFAQTWATAVSKHQTEDRAIVFRFIKDFPGGFQRSAYPDRIILVWRYQSVSGMPSRTEREHMDKLEDLLTPLVEANGVSTLVLVSTGEHFREWTYYAKTEGEFLTKLDEALRSQAPFPIEIHAAPDPSWSTYERFRKSIKQ